MIKHDAKCAGVTTLHYSLEKARTNQRYARLVYIMGFDNAILQEDPKYDIVKIEEQIRRDEVDKPFRMQSVPKEVMRTLLLKHNSVYQVFQFIGMELPVEKELDLGHLRTLFTKNEASKLPGHLALIRNVKLDVYEWVARTGLAPHTLRKFISLASKKSELDETVRSSNHQNFLTVEQSLDSLVDKTTEALRALEKAMLDKEEEILTGKRRGNFSIFANDFLRRPCPLANRNYNGNLLSLEEAENLLLEWSDLYKLIIKPILKDLGIGILMGINMHEVEKVFHLSEDGKLLLKSGMIKSLSVDYLQQNMNVPKAVVLALLGKVSNARIALVEDKVLLIDRLEVLNRASVS